MKRAFSSTGCAMIGAVVGFVIGAWIGYERVTK